MTKTKAKAPQKKNRSAALLTDEAIEALIVQRDMAAAQTAIDARLAARADDADALFYRAACAMVARRFNDASIDFAAAANLIPDEIRFRTACAAAALAGGRPEEALDITERMLEQAPDDLATLINHVQALLKLGRFPAAQVVAARLLELDASLPEARQAMGEAQRGMGMLQEAMKWFESCLASDPADPRPKVDIAVCIGRMGDHRAAVALASQTIDQAPADPEYYGRLGIRAQEAASPFLALHFFREGHARFPNDLTLCVNLGITLQGLGQIGESLYYFQQALALDEKCAAALYFSGQAYQGLRQQQRAIDCLEKCIEFEPRHAQALASLAWLRKDFQGRADDAKALLREAIEHDPKWLQPYQSLYHFLFDSGEYEEAKTILDKADLLAPDSESLRQARASLLLKQGDIASANAIYRDILAKQPSNPDAMSGLLFCSNYDPELTPEQIAAAYKSWDERFVRWRAPPPGFRHTNDPDPERRLRLAYIGGDFRQHSVAFFSEPLLANHDHANFEVYCYANQRGSDAVTTRMIKMADHWRWIYNMGDDAVVEMIRLDGIDILIDLSNHTAYHRLYTMAHKPAPLQMTTIGMPTTTGLSTIDYRITDAYMDPEGMTEHLHSEKLLRILSHWCYRPPDDAADLPVSALPALTSGHLTFASFNAFGKINHNVFHLWGRLLQAIPSALLYVATGGKEEDEVLNEQVRSTCVECGVPIEQLRLLGRKPFKEYFEFHQNVDIVLDSFPYTGATVTAHALWMGVPVITLAGPTPIHRSATSMMNSVGLPEFIANTQDEYVAIARRCADDLLGLAEIRRTLRPTMQQSPLMDGARVTRDLEEKLRQVWREWCKAQPNRPGKKIQNAT